MWSARVVSRVTRITLSRVLGHQKKANPVARRIRTAPPSSPRLPTQRRLGSANPKVLTLLVAPRDRSLHRRWELNSGGGSFCRALRGDRDVARLDDFLLRETDRERAILRFRHDIV